MSTRRVSVRFSIRRLLLNKRTHQAQARVREDPRGSKEELSQGAVWRLAEALQGVAGCVASYSTNEVIILLLHAAIINHVKRHGSSRLLKQGRVSHVLF